jgi:hypothetical protein
MHTSQIMLCKLAFIEQKVRLLLYYSVLCEATLELANG